MNLDLGFEDLQASAIDFLTAGVDEAGRGALVGGVYAAAVILDSNNPISFLTDSKKITEKRRFLLADEIKQKALSFCVSFATNSEIDEINIHNASLLAMQRAVLGLKIQPELVLVDGKFTPPNLNLKCEAVIKGDLLFACISAASILAKTQRDASMLKLDKKYPDFGFAKHKGYPTKNHLQALQKFGVLPEHRKSYAPVANLLK